MSGWNRLRLDPPLPLQWVSDRPSLTICVEAEWHEDNEFCCEREIPIRKVYSYLPTYEKAYAVIVAVVTSWPVLVEGAQSSPRDQAPLPVCPREGHSSAFGHAVYTFMVSVMGCVIPVNQSSPGIARHEFKLDSNLDFLFIGTTLSSGHHPVRPSFYFIRFLLYRR